MTRRRRFVNWWDGLSTRDRDMISARAVVVVVVWAIVWAFWGNLTGEGR